MLSPTERIKVVMSGPVLENPIKLWHASAMQIWLGFFRFDETTPASLSDFAGLQTIEFEVYDRVYPTGTLLASVTVPVSALATTMTKATWEDGTDANFVVPITLDETSMEVKGNVGTFHYVMYATYATGRYVFAAGQLLMARNNAANAGLPPGDLDMYYTKAEVDAMFDAFAVNESPYMICDTELQLATAISQGRWAVIRGEGNGGEIPITAEKQVSVRGTQVLGYGYKPETTAYYGRLKGAFTSLDAYGGSTAQKIFDIQTSDFRCAGVEIVGRDENDFTFHSPVAFYLAPTFDINNITIEDCFIEKVVSGVAKWGFIGALPTRNFRFRRNQVQKFQNNGLGIQQSLYDARVSDNRFNGKPAGYSLSFPNCQAVTLTADVNDAILNDNRIENCVRWGIEMTSTVISGTTFHTMLRNKAFKNTVLSCGSGISMVFAKDGMIGFNTLDGITSVGLESGGAGSFLGQSSGKHNVAIHKNIVRNVAGAGADCCAISSDNSDGDVITNNDIFNVDAAKSGSAIWSYSKGISLWQNRGAIVRGNNVNEVNGSSIIYQPGSQGELLARYMIENNVCRATTALAPEARYGVIGVFDGGTIRNNVAWEPTTGTAQQRFYSYGLVNARIYAGHAAEAPLFGDAFFTGSNHILTFVP